MEAIENIFQTEIVQRVGWTLMHFVWQAAAIGLVLAIVLKLLHKSSANLRYVIACMALALVVLMPAVTVRMVDVSVETIEPVKQVAVNLPKVGADTQVVVEMPQAESPPAQVAASPRVPLKDRFVEAVEPALPFVVVGWLVGVFGLSLWHLGGWRQLQKLRRQMVKQVTPALKAKLQQLSNALGIQKAIGLVESALVQVPMVVGHLKPVILLPASALTGLSCQQIEAILAHELAHIKRCDYLVNMLQTVVEILGFYHPAVWWVSHKIRIERENCCDDIAVSVCNDRICYARALATMEEIRADQPALAVAASGGSLLMRIRRLLGKDSTNEAKLSWLPSVIAILLIVALLIPTALALSSNKNKQADVKNDRIRVYQVNRNVSDFPLERDLSTPEKAYAYANKLLADGQSLRDISEPELKEKMPIQSKKRKVSDVKQRLNAQILEVRVFRDTHSYVIVKVPQLLKDDYNVRHFKLVEGQWLNLGEGGSLTLDGARTDFNLMCQLYDRKDNPLEYSDEIKQAAKQLFDGIKDADYEAFLSSKKKTWWNDFPTWDTYMAVKWHDELVKWICNTFKENPIVKVELGEVFTSDVKAVDLKNLPAVPYKLTLKDGGIIEGNLPFRYFPERKGSEVKAYWQGLHGIDWHLQDEPINKPDVQAEGSYRIRHFVRVVVGEDGTTFQGKQASWDELPSLLEQVPNRDITVLEVGFTKFPQNLRSMGKRNDWRRNNPAWQKAVQLREQFGFEYLSFVGKHKLGTVSGGTRNYLVRPMLLAKQIEVSLPSAEDKPLVYLNTIKFLKDKAVITAEVTSYPKTKWDIEIAFFDQKMRRLDYIFKNYENSGIIKGVAVNHKEMIEVDISKIKDIEKAKFFELSIKQAENRDQQTSKSENTIDIKPGDFKLQFNSKRSVYSLVVSIKNESSITLPEFKLRFYKDDPAKNLDEAGNPHSGWHGAGPIEPGKQWNEKTRDFYLPDGEYEFSVVLDYDNTISESAENNNTISIKVVIKDGHIKNTKPSAQNKNRPNENIISAFDELITAIRKNDTQKLREIAIRQAEAFNFTGAQKQDTVDALQLDAIALRTYKGIEDLEIYTIEKQNGRTELLTSEVTDARGVTGRLSFGVFGKDKVILDGFGFVANDGTRLALRPQVLTSAYIISVPADLPQLKEIISEDKSKAKMITPEKLEEFLKVIDASPGARVIASPKLLTNDNQDGEIRYENPKDFESMKLNIKNHVAPDRKTIRLELDFEYLVSAGQDLSSSSMTTMATILSDHAIAVAGSIPLDGQTVLLLVKPKILEWQSSKTGVVATNNDKKDFRPQKETVGPSGRQPKGNCSISGKVISAQDGKPVDKAKVYLFCMATHDAIFIVPASDGSFEFKDIPSSGYFLSVIHTPGFQNQQYNPENSTGQCKQFSLKNGEQRSDIVFELKREFTISGKVFDENGQPYSTGHSKVIVWHQSTKDGGPGDLYYPNGHQSRIGSDGSYLIEALDGSPVYVMVYDYDSDKKDDYYSPCYYPGTVLRNEAKLISFDGQPNVQSIDIRLQKTGELVLKGTVVDEAGKPVPEAFVAVHHREMLFDFATAYTNEQGNYEIPGIGGGELLAHVDAVHRGFVRTRTPIDIDTANKITQLDFTLKHGVTISGKFVNTNGNDWEIGNSFGHANIKDYPSLNSSFSRTGFRNKYRPKDVKESSGGSFLPGQGDYGSGEMIFPTDNTFVLQGMMPGRTIISFSPKKDGQALKEILYNGQNIMETGIETKPGEEIDNITIVIETDFKVHNDAKSEKQFSKTGVVASDELKSEKEVSKKDKIEITARALLVPIDANEIISFFEEKSLEDALVNINGDLNLKSCFLDDKQVEQLLMLSNTNPGSKPLALGKVVVNGEAAIVKTSQTIRYTDNSANSNEPEVKDLLVGTVFQVKPTLQEGGKRILLDIEFKHTNLIGFVGDGLPQTEITHIKSRISVPDGDTIVFGGQKITDDQDGQKVQKVLLCLIKAIKLGSSKPPLDD